MKIERILPRVLWCVSLRSRLGCDLDSQFLVFNLQGSPRSCHERSQWRLPVLFSDSAFCVLYGPPVAIRFSLLFINPCVPGCSLTLVSLHDVFFPPYQWLRGPEHFLFIIHRNIPARASHMTPPPRSNPPPVLILYASYRTCCILWLTIRSRAFSAPHFWRHPAAAISHPDLSEPRYV